MTAQFGAAPPGLGSSETGGAAHASSCPLCGSTLGRARITTNTVSLVECSACAGEGIAFWVTVQAEDDAARLRASGRAIDPERTRRLIGIRAHEGEGSLALVRQSDMAALVSGSS